LCWAFSQFVKGSQNLPGVGFELWSSWSLPPE
jgi:hypothetical protein